MTAVHMPGRVWPGAHDPWGHCKAIRRRVGGFMAVHHTLKPPACAGFGLLCTPNLALPSWGFWCVAMERGGSTHAMEGSCLDAPGSHLTCHGRFDAGVGPSDCMVHRTAYRLQAPKLVTGRPGSLPSPWHGKVAGSARTHAMTAVHMPGRVWPGAHDPWGHCKAIRRRVGGFMAVHHTLKPPARAGFGLLCTKFGTSELGFLVCGDGTGGFHACHGRVLLDAPGPHLTCHGRFDAGVGPSDCMVHRTAYRLQAPKLVTGRAGSLPSPWHGKVAGSAMTAVHMLGRVWPGANDPWGHCKAIRRRVGGFMAVHHTLKPPARAGFGLLCTKFGTSELGFLVCGDGTGGFHA